MPSAKHSEVFDLRDFLPYLLNQAAEESSLEFSRIYRERYAILRTEWRVLFHLGRYGEMTASQIVALSKIHKTKISRAVSALEAKHFLKRVELPADRRHEVLTLLPRGQDAYRDLFAHAERYNAQLMKAFSAEEWAALKSALQKLAKLPAAN